MYCDRLLIEYQQIKLKDMTQDEKIDIYNEVDNFVEENEGEVTHTEIARHFFELGRNNAIDKACEWLKEYIKWNDLCTLEDIEQFRKAMKGGE